MDDRERGVHVADDCNVFKLNLSHFLEFILRSILLVFLNLQHEPENEKVKPMRKLSEAR